MPDGLDFHLMTKLQERESLGIRRRLPPDQSSLVDFASNDYLGLARSRELYRQIEEECRRSRKSNGSTGSRLLTGNDPYTEEVERELATTFQSESALIFGSGYSANLSVLSSIPRKGDTILYDELSHASIKDGARLSLAKRFSFSHNDLADLERKIGIASGRIYIVVESVYSMDGDVCPLREIAELARKKEAVLILDEAHSTGAVGRGGSGMAVEMGLADEIPVRIYTFGKAMGIHGACVAGSNTLREYLVNFARPFIYTTAPDSHAVASIRSAFAFLKEHPELQEGLRKNVELYLQCMTGIGNRTKSSSAIQTLIISGADEVRKAAGEIRSAGIDVRPIVSPTVANGAERLRICLHTYNTDDEIETLAYFLKAYTTYA